MQFCSPFKTSATRTFQKIDAGKEGHVYMLQTGGLSPVENPAEDQAREKEIADLQWIILQAIRRVAAELNISVAAARKLLFEAPVKDASNPESADDSESALSTEIDEERRNADDYLTKEEMFALRNMRSSRLDLAKQATTKLMRYRMAYALELKGDMPSTSSAFSVAIVPAFFEAAEGSTFAAKGGTLTLSAPLNVNDKVAHFNQITDHPTSKLVAGDALFLADASGVEKVGCEWTDEMTESVPYTLLFAIRAFFEQEARGVSDADIEDAITAEDENQSDESQDDELGKSSKGSVKQKAKKRSIGDGSISDSNISDAATAA
jgi:hypothetical protein